MEGFFESGPCFLGVVRNEEVGLETWIWRGFNNRRNNVMGD